MRVCSSRLFSLLRLLACCMQPCLSCCLTPPTPPQLVEDTATAGEEWDRDADCGMGGNAARRRYQLWGRREQWLPLVRMALCCAHLPTCAVVLLLIQAIYDRSSFCSCTFSSYLLVARRTQHGCRTMAAMVRRRRQAPSATSSTVDRTKNKHSRLKQQRRRQRQHLLPAHPCRLQTLCCQA